jgi:hypothetical protein
MRRTDDEEPPDDWNDPGKVTRPVCEYLDALDKAAGLSLLSGESPQSPKSLSLTDPSAARCAKPPTAIPVPNTMEFALKRTSLGTWPKSTTSQNVPEKGGWGLTRRFRRQFDRLELAAHPHHPSI